MKKVILKSALVLGVILSVVSCKKEDKKEGHADHKKERKHKSDDEKTKEVNGIEITEYHVLSEEDQKKLTPDMVLQQLAAGNERFRTGALTARDHSTAVLQAVDGQYPKAYVLSCIDSRVPVEDVLDQGIGDLFVGRVAGNFVDVDQLGSMEYAVKSGSKVIMVLGHESCGAIKSTIDDVKLGNITEMLTKIKPAVAMTNKTFTGEKSTKNKQYVHDVAINNVKNTIEEIRKRSPYIKEKEDKGEIKIVGAYYSLKDAKIERINYQVDGLSEN